MSSDTLEKIRSLPQIVSFDPHDLHQCVILSDTDFLFEKYIDEYLNQNKNAVDKTNEDGKSILIFACEKLSGVSANSTVKTILKHNPEINLRDNFGNTALHYACVPTHWNEFKPYSLLLDAGASLMIKNNEGRNAFSIAVNTVNLTPAKLDHLVRHFCKEQTKSSFEK